MRTQWWMVIVLACVFAAGCGREESVSVESPPPTLEPKMAFESILEGEPVRYTVDLQEGQLLIAGANAINMDMELTLYDASDQKIAYDDDGGPDRNALLTFVAQVSGTYFIEIHARDGAGLSYFFWADIVSPVRMEVDSTVQLAPRGIDPVFVVFAGTSERVINLAAASQGKDRIRMTLYDATGRRADSDSSDGPGYTPYMRRVIMPNSGLYLIKVEPIFDDPLSSAVDVTLTSTERLYVTDTPHEVTLGDDGIGLEVFTLDVVTGKTYRLIIENSDETGIDLELEGTDETIAPDIDLALASRIAWDFQATNTGLWQLIVRPESRSKRGTFSISLGEVE